MCYRNTYIINIHFVKYQLFPWGCWLVERTLPGWFLSLSFLLGLSCQLPICLLIWVVWPRSRWTPVTPYSYGQCNQWMFLKISIAYWSNLIADAYHRRLFSDSLTLYLILDKHSKHSCRSLKIHVAPALLLAIVVSWLARMFVLSLQIYDTHLPFSLFPDSSLCLLYLSLITCLRSCLSFRPSYFMSLDHWDHAPSWADYALL